MRILLAQKLPYIPSFTGASKLAKSLLEQLVSKNHCCRVVALTADSGSVNAPIEVFNCNGVEVHAIPQSLQLNLYLIDQIKTFRPTRTVISEDPNYGLLGASLETHPEATIFLSQSQATLPFGPESFTPDPKNAQLLRRAAGIVTISRYLKD